MLLSKDIWGLKTTKQDPFTCCLPETQNIKRHTDTKSKGIEKLFHENGNKQESCGSNAYTRKTDFKTKAITRDKERLSNFILGIYLKKT